MSAKTHHILTILAVDDLKSAVDFYRAGFGWELRVEAPVYVEFALPDERRLGVYERESFAKNTGILPELPKAGATSGTELYFHCNDLEETIGRLEAAGARILSELAERPWGDEAAYFSDPDGNVLVLARPHS